MRLENMEAHDLAIEWAQKIVAAPCIFLDTETTGLGKDDEVVQLALGFFDQQHVKTLDIEYLFIPLCPISKEASDVTGWTMEKLRSHNAAWFGDSYGKLYYWLAHRRVIAYNAAFDQRLLDQTCQKHGFPIIPAQWECAMLEYARFYGDWNAHRRGWRWQKLTAAVEQMGLETGNAHDAMGDVAMTIALVQTMAGAETLGGRA